jgi:aryl carrier-like protein
VTLGDGQVVQVDSAEAAERIRSDLLLAHSEQEAEGMVAEVEKWTRERPDIRREATLTGDMVQVQGGKLQATGADGVTVRPITDAKTLESVRRQTEGMGQDLEGQTINGSNDVFKEIVGETAGQLVQLITVNRGMNQAAWMTFLHERAEANFKGAKMTNAISHAEIGAGLAVAAQALPVEPVKARLAALQKRGAHAEHIAEATKELELRERLQRLASGQGTEIEAQEMAVELAMAEVMGRDKRGGRTGFAPGRLDALLRDAAMTATTAHEVTALGKFRALLRSVRAWLRGVLGTVAGIEKARREGKLKDGDDFGALVDTMLGLEDSKFSKAVEREASGLLGETWAANTSFSLAGPRSQDADYLAAVERGDMETAQRMVDEAAKAAGYDVGPVYHGTSQRFNEFDIQRLNSRNEGPGFYFTTSQQIASGYVNRDGNEGRLISAYLGIKKPMKYDEKPFSPRVLDKLLGRIAALEAIKYNADAKDGFLANFGDTYSNGIQGAINDAVKLLANDTSAVDQISGLVGAGVDAAIVLQALTETTGFDGIKAYGFSNEGSKDNVIYVAFRPSQIKSADPVTYDDDGNVIPLSQRFDPQSNLISYSLSPARRMELVEFNEGVSFSLSGAQDADYLAAVERGDMAEAQRMVDEAAKRAGFTEKAYHGTPNGFFNTFDQKQSPGWYIGIEEDSKGNYEDGVYWFSDSKFNAQTYAQGLFDEGSNPIDPSKSIPVDQKPLPSGTVVKWWPGKGKKPITLTKEQVDSNTLPLEALTPTGKMKRGSQLQVELPNGFAAGGAMFTRRNLGKEPTTPKRALELALDAYNAPLSQRVKSVVIPVFLDIGKSAEEDMKGESFSRMGKRAASYRAKGYDSVKFKNVIDPGALPMRAEPQTSIAVFTPNQIKSADPVTYDDDGNVIPLSQRFDPQSDLISYSLSPARRMELVENRLAVVLKDQPQRRAEIAKNAIAAVRAIAKRYEGISALSFIDPSEEIARLQADRDADIEAVRQERDFEIEGAKEQKAGGEAIENFKRKADAKLAKIKADFDLAKLKLETDANAKNQATLKRLDRSILIQNLATLEAVTRFLPAQVRAKVGGHMAIARLTTDEARVKEILRRIDKIGPLLESYLKADLSKRIESTLEKAMPERANGEKPKGKLGAETHEFFDRVQRVIDTPLEDVEAEASKLRTQFEKEQDADKQMTLLQELSALEVFGGTFEKSAAELEEIAGILEQAYKNGRDFWKGVLEQRRGSDAALRDLAFAELDNLGRHSDQQKGANKKRGKFSQMARALFSFRQILKSVFGRNSRLSDHFADQQTKAEGAYRDGVSAVEVALHGQLAAIVQRRGMTKGGGKMEARRMVAKLMREWTTERNVNVRVMEGRKVHKDSMSLDDARQALADENKAWSKSQRDEMQEQIDDFDIASFIGSRKGKKKVVAWTVVEDSGTESTLQLTQAEAAYILAIDAQTDLRDALRNTGGTAYTDDSIADIMAALDPDVLAVKDWMVRYLEADHKPLSKAYSDLHGVNLPHIPNYFHALFTHDGNTLAPELGGAAGGSLMQNGWTRQRKKHAAQLLLDFEQGAINIFTVFMRHVPQVEHWKAYSPLVREMKSVINSGMVQNAIKAKVGGSDLDELNGWLGAVEMGGVQDAKLNQAFSDFIRKRIGAKSASILGFRLSTLLVNTTGALNTALDTSLPMREILRSYGRVTVGKGVKSVGEVLAMPVIQRRISQGGNITANYIKSLSESGDINFLTFDVNQAAMEAASMVDAKSSAVALAAAYDAHYRQAKKSGADDASAHQYAEEATERTAQKVLQPLELGAKGRLELSTNPWWKLVSMFMSETRQKLALEIEAFTKGADGKIDWRRAGRVAMVNHLVIGTAVWLMRSIARDMLTSSEGDDDPAWEWENWLSCVICGPLAGMPLIGTALESTISYALQGFQYNSGTNPVLDGIQSMTGGARQFVGGMGDILTGNLNGEEIEDTLKGLNKLFGGIAVIYGTPAFTGTAVASNVVTQAWQAYNNLLGEE